MMLEEIKLDAEKIAELMPQQSPYMFIDQALIRPNEVFGKYTIKGNEFFLKGHFKNNPVMPASIMMEALGQLGVLYLLAAPDSEMPVKADASKIFFASADGVRCSKICRPGETLEMNLRIEKLRAPICLCSGRISTQDQRAVIVEKISLTFELKK